MTTRTWAGGAGYYADDSQWAPTGAPQPGDTAIIGSGTAFACWTTLRDQQILLAGTQSDTPVLALRSVHIAADTSIMSFWRGFTSGTPGNARYGTLELSGRSVNDGVIEARDDRVVGINAGGDLTVRIGGSGRPDLLINRGSLVADFHGQLTITAEGRNDALVNRGTIEAEGHVTIDAKVLGTGEMQLGPLVNVSSRGIAHGVLDIGQAVGTGQSIGFAEGAELRLHDVAEFHASINDFAYVPPSKDFGLGTERIELIGTDITQLRYLGGPGHGTLLLFGAHGTAGALRFAGSYDNASFALTHQGADSIITLTPS